jgi:hypothetical protein
MIPTIPTTPREFVRDILVIAGLGATLLAGFDVLLLIRGTPSPERVTIAALGAEDGIRNAHLSVVDFQFGELIVEGADEERGRIWLPLLAQDGQWTDRPVVIHTPEVSEPELKELLAKETVTGVVSNGMQSLGLKQRDLFAAIYPSADLRGAIAIQLNGRFPNPYVAYPVTIAGIIALAFGLRLTFTKPEKYA